MRLDGNHYHILRVSVDRQVRVSQALAERFPPEHGRVFLPRWEYYRRDTGSLDIKPLFSGYIFVHTDLKRTELYRLLREMKMPKPVRSQLMQTDLEHLWTEKEDLIFDMTEEEEAFFDQILDGEGVERMSRGYCDPRAVVMEGPLKPYGNRIVKLDRRNRLAWLDRKLGEERIMAGFQVEPKEVWFPET